VKKAFYSVVAAAAACLATLSTSAHAAWPSDAPIEVVVGFAAGGTTDVMMRSLAPFVAKQLGNGANLVIVNRPGASGEIAVSQVMHAKPDGYTIGIVNLPGFFFVPMYKKASYTTKDVTLLARIVSDPTVMVARKDSKLTDLKQVVTQLKGAPSSLSAGHNGVGTNGHLALVRLEKSAGVTMNAIPYNGSAQQKTAIAGSQLDIAFLAASEVPDPDNEATPMRLLAQFTKTKVARLNSIPTTYELGFPVEMTAERGLAAPNNVPAPVMDRLQKAIEAAMKDPEYIKAARNDAPFLSFLGGAEWTRQIEQDRKAYEEIARTLPKE
jgi:tripartite-type tricarboxylate transporter receptor subunit TctC